MEPSPADTLPMAEPPPLGDARAPAVPPPLGDARACAEPSAAADADARPCWAELAPNVLLRVFEALTLQDLVHAGQACLAWHAVTTNDSLWSSFLHGAAGACCATPRVRLGQLRTTSLWATGMLSVEATTMTTREVKTLPLSVSSTEPRKLWSAQQARQQAGADSANATFAVSAAAAGRSHIVLLGGTGQVVDSRGAFVLQPSTQDGDSSASAAVNATAAAANLRLLLVDLLHSSSSSSSSSSLEMEPHWHVAASWLRRGQYIIVRNPWLPSGGVPVTSVASGDGHVLAIAGGRLWGWGSNQAGQLGLGSCSDWQATPADVTAALDGAWKSEEAESVLAAACGSNHSVLLTESGAVYTAGCNSSGQCGQDIQLKQCPVFCQPHMAAAAPTAGASPPADTHRASSSRQQRPRNTGSSDSPDASTLPDPTTAASDPPTRPRALLPAAAAIAAGHGNTLVVTQSGRVLVCGTSGSGQCGAAWAKEAVCPGFVDVGPEVSWHGLTRPSAAEVEAAGGQVADALAKVVAVAAGEGTCYALTDGGEVYAWGQGSKGQLGTGGCPKVQATPAKLPWARQIRHISASPTGQFAAAVDTAGKLYTWGSGKWGQLGHGDTSKRTVGRLVKSLRHLDVLQVCCCAEGMLVLTAQHIPDMMQQQQHHHSTHSTSEPTLPGQQNAQSPTPKQRKDQHTMQQQTATALAQAEEQASSSRASSSSKHGRRSRQQQERTPASAPAASSPSGSSSTAAAEQVLGDMSGVGWQDVDEEGPFFCPAPSSSSSSRRRSTTRAADPEDAGASSSSTGHLRRAGSSSSAGSTNTSGSTGSPQQQQRHPRMDKGFKRLLRRLLTGFMADSSQREMSFPASLSAADRYHVHVAAEAYGLAHASHTEGSDRVIKVWKVSRTRKAYSGGGYGSDSESWL